MKLFFNDEDDEVLIDFSDRGSNKEVLVEEASQEHYDEILKTIGELDYELEDMELKDIVEVIIVCANKYNW
jgi:hypothetical protein